MDITYTVNETSGITQLPWVGIRAGCDAILAGDSAIVRVEHHWAPPDVSPVAPYVDELSSTHFWVVDGIWPEGLILDARIQYDGSDSDELDHDLYGMTEADAFLAWRSGAGEPWVEFPDYEWQSGSLSNGAGLFRIPQLLKGQYAFANGDVSLSVNALPSRSWSIGPNPAVNDVQVLGEHGRLVEVFDGRGACVLRIRSGDDTPVSFSVANWPAGSYVVRCAREAAGQTLVVSPNANGR
jgi:hypothetical protein